MVAAGDSRGTIGRDCEHEEWARGLFSKEKSDDQEKIGVKGMPVNPKLLGGPSTTALSPDDPCRSRSTGSASPTTRPCARECSGAQDHRRGRHEPGRGRDGLRPGGVRAGDEGVDRPHGQVDGGRPGVPPPASATRRGRLERRSTRRGSRDRRCRAAARRSCTVARTPSGPATWITVVGRRELADPLPAATARRRQHLAVGHREDHVDGASRRRPPSPRSSPPRRVPCG